MHQLEQHIVGGRLLDFGCADGFFLSTVRVAGWDIAGVELSRYMAEQAQREPTVWEGDRPPSHLLFLTEKTLRDILQRAGFTRIQIQRTAPLPPLPGWLRRWSAPLQHALATGHMRWWPLACLAWRGIRLFGWGWQKITQPQADVYMTLEIVAFKPAS